MSWGFELAPASARFKFVQTLDFACFRKAQLCRSESDVSLPARHSGHHLRSPAGLRPFTLRSPACPHIRYIPLSAPASDRISDPLRNYRIPASGVWYCADPHNEHVNLNEPVGP
ncbi:hypothetical protein AG1IA_08199 [Rhizoctonia solani AG-1 IA]|uniref:Uncharacterized protein n=1 Tax=Thanatephorus cucumeris (strain AG1-IA) TaxID=983506 RepID=L8WLU7_THACA|nr:hypothetical protein AG1IA_08199 [Rhizoctonia solani AG-1 IA]